jgi:hypothetical protein
MGLRYMLQRTGRDPLSDALAYGRFSDLARE